MHVQRNDIYHSGIVAESPLKIDGSCLEVRKCSLPFNLFIGSFTILRQNTDYISETTIFFFFYLLNFQEFQGNLGGNE